jgi:transposase
LEACVETDGVIGVSAERRCGRLLLSKCENVVDVDSPQHLEGAAMKYFAGLDVSLEETAICVVDESGRIMKERRAASEPEALSEALREIALPLERIGLEACSLTAWLHDGLRAEGLPTICIETRQANAAMKTMPNKTDRNDALALAQIMRTGWYRQVHVKSRQCRLWRALLVARRTVLNEMRSIENVVRAMLRETGVKLGTPSRTAFADRVRELAGAEVMAMVEPLLAILSVMLKEFTRLTKQVLHIVRKEEVCRRLMSAPGVGPITALAFRATVDRPERFGSSRAVGAHLGLTPARYQSGETDVQGKVSRCGDELARTALYEAAHSLLVRSKKWSSLRAWGMNIARRRGMARARVAVARKLGVILHRMWADATEFRFGKEPAALAA